MKILVLDDDKKRLEMFQKNLIGHVVTCVETAKEAIEELAKHRYSCVFLDHDLGGQVYVKSAEGTGWEVAKWLSEHPKRKPKLVVTHSFNEPGRKNICAILPGTLEAPGIWTMPIQFERKSK